jgi:hypothetical protein
MRSGLPQGSCQVQLRWGSVGMVYYYNRNNTWDEVKMCDFVWVPHHGDEKKLCDLAEVDEALQSSRNTCGAKSIKDYVEEDSLLGEEDYEMENDLVDIGDNDDMPLGTS